MRSPTGLVAIAVVSALIVGLAIAVALGGSSGHSSSVSQDSPFASGFYGAALPNDVRARDFTLTDQSGRRVSLSRYRGRVTILTFLYSTCQSTCVLIAQQIRGALDELGISVPVLAVSVDPGADTPAHVRAFLDRVSLAGRFEYLTGSRSELQPIWHTYRITPASAGETAYARSAAVVLLDRQGRERVVFQLEQLTPDGLAHDVRKLR
jgi:protein SCO1